MKYSVEIGSGAMIYVTNIRKDWFRQSKVDREDSQTHIQHHDCLSLLKTRSSGKNAFL
jgi:hypothetical protein